MYSEVIEINKKILEAERSSNPSLVRDYLSPQLLFRRANGNFSDEEKYLEQLRQTNYTSLEQTSTQFIRMTESSACTVITIEAKGVRPDKTEFSGVFRNARFFRKEKKGLVLYAWRNDELIKGEAKPLTQKDRFTGEVAIGLLQERPIPDGGRWQNVFFHPGARTHWHIHPWTQELFIVAGTALVVIKKEDGEDLVHHLNPGGQEKIEAGRMHWHGASGGSFMVHIAYNKFNDTGETSYWFDPVTAEQYKKAIDAHT